EERRWKKRIPSWRGRVRRNLRNSIRGFDVIALELLLLLPVNLPLYLSIILISIAENQNETPYLIAALGIYCFTLARCPLVVRYHKLARDRVRRHYLRFCTTIDGRRYRIFQIRGGGLEN